MVIKYNKKERILIQIVNILLKEKLSYWESVGVLEHVKMEIHNMVDEKEYGYTKN